MIAVLASGLFSQLILGATVDQGAPGKQGAWPVSVNGAVISSGAVTIDGGILGTVTDVTNVATVATVTNVTTVGTLTTVTNPVTIAPNLTANNIQEANSGSLSANATPCTTAGGASCTTILASTNSFYLYQNCTIWLINTGGNTIDNVLIQWSPNNVNFEVWDSTTFASLAAGAVKSLALTGNSRQYLRIQARAAANTTFTLITQCTNRSY